MEKRAFLAVALMAAVLILYQTFLAPPIPDVPPASPPQQQAEKPATPAPGLAPVPKPSEPAAPAVPAAPAEPRPPQRLARVTTPLYDAVISSEGGKLQELTLKYRGEKPMVIVGELGPAGLVIGSKDAPSGTVIPMQLSADALSVTPDKPSELVLTGTHEGLRIREVVTFRADAYAIDAHVRVENPSAAPRAVTVALPWFTRQDWRDEKPKERFQGQHPTEIVWSSSNGHVTHDENLCKVPPLSSDGQWIGMGSVWYMAALVPRSEGFKLVAQGDDKACDAKTTAPVGRATIAVQAAPTIAPGQAWEGRVTIFVGPKEYDRLKAFGLETAINFGGFPVPRQWGGLPMDWLGVPILLLMNWVYRHVGNYGVAIILLTVVSKVLFYPLTVKSMRSMKAMQALAPQINALRNKYKSDPQRLQRETMDLYRQHKVNPMGGCLPMVAQVPIFYALYLALSVSVELQNATFLCIGRVFGLHIWICDLASHDPTYVLPILMGVTMFIQQKMTPTAGDPRQAKMMLVMPFIFTFMFLNLPAGLVLYWTVSNVLQIAQQKFMDRPKARTA